MKYSVTVLSVILSLAAVASAQFPQMRTVEERTQQKSEEIARTEAELKQLAAQNKAAGPRKPAVMNVDVQMALTRDEQKTFAAAKPLSLTRIADGDPVWLNLKFNGKLGTWVDTVQNADGTERYLLYIEYGPAGDVSAKGHESLEFSKDELELTEMKLSLAPGRWGNNRSLSLFIKNMASAKPGVWNSELRIARTAGFPRDRSDYLAKAAFTADLSKGLKRYATMLPVYRSMVLRDSMDETIMPLVGKFDNTAVRASINEKLAAAGIAPGRVYFAADRWTEYSDEPASVRQYRSITGVYVFNKENTCHYGTADVIQKFDGMRDSYGDTEVTLSSNIQLPCTSVK